ncbi:unnamed protein product [Ilex paraguariensis]|uniref:RRM domain-containing protein n=1 Tax=Ilex paraguariensis TaxID=185542 RepID=A0ABC8TCA5_9AQUA
MAISRLTSSSPLVCKIRNGITEPSSSFPTCVRFCCPKQFSCLLVLSTSSSSLLWHTTTTNHSNKTRHTSVLAVAQEEQLVATIPADKMNSEEVWASRNILTCCQLYVCNLPRSFGITELHDMFKPHGTIQSVEVSRNAETGISRGCGYVTMSSVDEAKAAITSLDGSDVGGREMRIIFSTDMDIAKRDLGKFNTASKKKLIFESPYKIYAGNIAWSVKPEDLRNLFSQFGTVVSARVLYDRKAGKNRVYGFLSFSSAAEREAAMSLDGTDFCGRMLLVREVFNKNET